MSGYTIIDVDTHVTETPDLWTSRAPARMRDQVPRIETESNGRMSWVVGGKSMLANPGMTATAGAGSFKQSAEDFRGDASRRIRCQGAPASYMDQMGIWAMVMYPNVGGFGAQQFLKLGDPELMLTCVQIYNDWQTEWASADSRRLLPITSLPFWDVDASAEEIRRCAAMGHRGNPVHWRTPILGAAAARRPSLESTVGGRGRAQSTDQLPYRFGQYGGRAPAEPDGGIWPDGGVYRTCGRYLSA